MEGLTVLLYVLVFPLTLFKNTMAVRCFIGTRPSWYYGSNQAVYELMVYGLSLASLGLIWYTFAAVNAIVCGLGLFTFSRLTFKSSYKKALLSTSSRYYNMMVSDEGYMGKSREEVQREAIKLAADSIRRSVMGQP
ncbi:BTB/POZ domain-containing protein [Geomonas propionica]|uniref:Uncharacterized protein n=1 Tax=Geomonas propionica TaxID=2798582 RepID=A0ABS0YU73_9BACT|nr:hypothetical protein [Geomonas propionica]MBJ6801505.1 hypothetical protein [Geomonas propionica]